MKKRRNPHAIALANEIAAYGEQLTRPAAAVPNPSRGILRPAAEITDRAKRYRAQNAIAQEEKRCIYCGATPQSAALGIDHIDGNEENGEAENLAYACNPCNTSKGIHFAAQGIGRLTRQANPTKTKGATSLGQWLQAVGAITPRVSRQYSLVSEMETADALRLIRDTPPARRAQFAAEIWRRRRERGSDRQVPF